MTFIKKVIPVLLFLLIQIYQSQIIDNTCNRKVLSSEEFDKCINDSVYKKDIELRINYFTLFTTAILPKYKNERIGIELNQNLQNDLIKLRKIYDSVSIKKISTLQRDGFKNGKYITPKSYIATTIAFQNFLVYPNTYAILVNEIHLQLNPKTKAEDRNFYLYLIRNIYKNIPLTKKSEILEVIKKLHSDKKSISQRNHFELFQNDLSAEESNKFDIIDFLLWTP